MIQETFKVKAKHVSLCVKQYSVFVTTILMHESLLYMHFLKQAICAAPSAFYISVVFENKFSRTTCLYLYTIYI